MTIEVTNKSKNERLFLNVISFSTGCKNVDGRYIYHIKIKQKPDESKEILLDDITSFSAYDAKATWIENAGNIICPYCGVEYEDDPYMNKTDNKQMKYCPQCGREVG